MFRVSTRRDATGRMIPYYTASEAGLLGAPAGPYKPEGAAVNTGLSISDNLVLAFLFSEGGGTGISDLAASPVNGTLADSSMWGTDSTYRYALDMSSYTGYVPYDAKFSGDTLSLSWAFKTSSTTYYGAMFNKDRSAAGYHNLLGSGQLTYQAYGDTGSPGLVRATDINNTSDGDWHKAVLTREAGASVDLYIDGILRARVADTITSVGTSTADLVLGGETYGDTFHRFQGQLGHFHMWDRVLTGAPASVGNTATGEIADLAADEFAMYR